MIAPLIGTERYTQNIFNLIAGESCPDIVTANLTPAARKNIARNKIHILTIISKVFRDLPLSLSIRTVIATW